MGPRMRRPGNNPVSLKELSEELRRFAKQRDWEQFHTPKNLAMALAGEAGELLALFQWLTEHEAKHIMDDSKRARRVREEIADVQAYLIRLADVLQIDLAAAVRQKTHLNRRRYPVAKAKGSAKKYTEL